MLKNIVRGITTDKKALKMIKRIAILGGGPSGLFMYKRLVETGNNNFTVDIFEAKERLGSGMPYSCEGANKEHITNVSGNEIPALVTSVMDWMAAVPDDTLKKYNLGRDWFNEFMVLPRLLFGEYLSAQFDLLQAKAEKSGLITHLHLNSRVTDIMDVAAKEHRNDRNWWKRYIGIRSCYCMHRP